MSFRADIWNAIQAEHELGTAEMAQALLDAADWLTNPFYTKRTGTPCATCGTDPCSLQCPNSPHYLSPEREKADALLNDSLSYDQWFREAVDQYERVHGEPYVS